MKMSAIEEIGPIGVQVGRQAAPGEIAEINNNYKEGKAQFTKHHLDLHRHRIYDLRQHYTIAKDENTISIYITLKESDMLQSRKMVYRIRFQSSWKLDLCEIVQKVLDPVSVLFGFSSVLV